MGDERSGCGTGAGTLVMAASAMPTAVEQQPQQLQQNFAEHLQQQQHIICGKCRGNNSTIWTIPCVYCEHSRNFPFYENKINNTHTHTHTQMWRIYRIFGPCLWNGKVPASGFWWEAAFAIRICVCVFTLPHKYIENIGWQMTWISFWWYCGHLEAAVIPLDIEARYVHVFHLRSMCS